MKYNFDFTAEFSKNNIKHKYNIFFHNLIGFEKSKYNWHKVILCENSTRLGLYIFEYKLYDKTFVMNEMADKIDILHKFCKAENKLKDKYRDL